MKRDDNYIYLCSKQSIGKYLNQNLTVSPICIYLFVSLLPKYVYLSMSKDWQVYNEKKRALKKKDKNGTVNNSLASLWKVN